MEGGLGLRRQVPLVRDRFPADDEAPRALALGVPVTTKYRGSPYEVRLGKLACFREESYANSQGLTALRWCDFLTMGGQVPPPLLEEIRKVLRFAMEL